jgi:hypothetical protein
MNRTRWTTPRFILNLHAQQQAHRRKIDFDDVNFVLANFDTRRDAQEVPGEPPSEFFVATVRGNRLRVYMEKGSEEPFEIKTVAWEVR